MDHLDRQIIGLLQQDGRRSNVEIAKALGVSEGTIRRRVERLLTSSGLQISTIVDPLSVGYRIRVLLFISAELAQIPAITRQLVSLTEVISVYRTLGEYDLVLEAAFESEGHLMAFVTDRLSQTPGVRASKTCLVPQILKHSYQWSLPQPPPARILIVDDDPDFAAVTNIVLQNEGYRTRLSDSGNAAVEMLLADPYDLVILDVMMEGVLDGWDAGRRIRADGRLHDIPILVVSSITSSDYLGMVPTDDDNLIDGFLSKPVAPQQLLTEVKRLLRMAGRTG